MLQAGLRSSTSASAAEHTFARQRQVAQVAHEEALRRVPAGAGPRLPPGAGRTSAGTARRLPHPSWPPPALRPQPTRPRGGRAWGGPGLGRAGVSVAGSGSGLGMALLSERAQPAEELVNDAAELTPHDQPVEHAGDRVGWRVKRLDPHRGLVACRRGESRSWRFRRFEPSCTEMAALVVGSNVDE